MAQTTRMFVVEVSEEDAQLLARLVGPGMEYVAETVDGLVAHLIRAAADGVRRPGSWERGWIVQGTGTVL